MAKPFELVAGHVALDLVNTLDNRFAKNGPDELLASYDDLLRFCAQSGLLTGRQAKKLKSLKVSGTEALRQAKELREALAVVAYAQLGGKPLPNLATLETYFRQASLHRHLIARQHRPVWRWRGVDSDVEAPVWLLAHATEQFLLSEASLKLRCCASETCRWLFFDTSKNHTRRWCDMRVCGNRMKARRFYARNAE